MPKHHHKRKVCKLCFNNPQSGALCKGFVLLEHTVFAIAGFGVERVAERIGRAIFLLFNRSLRRWSRAVVGAIFCLMQVDAVLELGFGLGSLHVACANFVFGDMP